MSRHFLPYAASLAVLALLLGGCHSTTHISREEQLSHITTAASAATTVITEAPATTLPTVETTAPETAPPTQPTTTKATHPKPTTPPPTTAPETAPDTDPTTCETEPAVTESDPYDISGHSCGTLEFAIADALNAQRAAQGLGDLSLSGRLSAISSVRAYEITLYFSHSRPDGRDCFTVLSDYGYGGYSRAAENLLQCSDGYTASDMVALWMGSAGHKTIILNPEFTAVGIGVYRANGMIYVATIFTV